MKGYTGKNNGSGNFVISLYLSLVVCFTVSCAHIDPAKVNVEIEKTRPIPKITSYTEALIDLGLMSEIYETPVLKIQSIPIYDNTGSSGPTGGEIPKDISEIVKSVLNSVGGNLIYIPYDPSFIQNQIVTGYSSFQNKFIPDVIISGGITEFDRGLETREKNTDVSSRLTYEGLPDYLPGLENEVPYPTKEINFRYGNDGKTGLARITLDFNMLNFQTLSGIPKMSTVNTIEVQKAVNEKELGISIFAQAFGRKGKIKKVQGRHAAIRLLVELSMIQLIGRQLILPYWNLLDEEALPDRVVIESVSTFYESLKRNQKIAFTQKQLFLYGYDLQINGELENNTITALNDFFYDETIHDILDVDHFIKLWTSIPINKKTLKRRRSLTEALKKIKETQAENINKKKPKILPKPIKKEEINVPNESETISGETLDSLLKILETKKRHQQEKAIIPEETMDLLFKMLDKKK